MEKKKILLVDDVQLFLEQEKTFFNRAQFDLLLATNGVEALEIVRENRPDLVFMDLYMPEMGGDECCRRIKSDDELCKIPVIMVTKGVSEEDFEKSWRSGCDDIIVKPINRHYFMAIARKYLNIQFRVTPRFIARLRIRYGENAEKLLTDYSINLSTGGVFIETEDYLPIDTILSIEFILPENEKTICCRGRVAWLNSAGAMVNPNLPAGIGLQFLDISPEDMNAVRQYIKKEALMPFW
ncbi:MAG TPA: response regulator [Geobacteraceae bacterium]|nr:response regulator [Geobacteraceae bacterium]